MSISVQATNRSLPSSSAILQMNITSYVANNREEPTNNDNSCNFHAMSDESICNFRPELPIAAATNFPTVSSVSSSAYLDYFALVTLLSCFIISFYYCYYQYADIIRIILPLCISYISKERETLGNRGIIRFLLGKYFKIRRSSFFSCKIMLLSEAYFPYLRGMT